MHHIHSYSALLQFLNNDIHVTLVCFRMLFISSTQKVVKEFLLYLFPLLIQPKTMTVVSYKLTSLATFLHIWGLRPTIICNLTALMHLPFLRLQSKLDLRSLRSQPKLNWYQSHGPLSRASSLLPSSSRGRWSGRRTRMIWLNCMPEGSALFDTFSCGDDIGRQHVDDGIIL